MFQAVTNASVRMVQRYLPDAFLFAVILTFLVFVAGIIVNGKTPMEMVNYWGGGFWSLLSFTMQMVLILITGHTLASTNICKRGLNALGSLAKTPGQAIVLVTVVSCVANWINWGFGLVISALLARVLANQVEKVDYRLLVASAYGGFVVWHGGLAGSVPLTIATEKHSLENIIGVIPTSETMFSPMNLTIVAAIMFVLPIVNRFMMPAEKDTIVFKGEGIAQQEMAAATDSAVDNTPASKMENSRLISVLVSTLGIIYLIYYFADKGFKLNLDVVIMGFLFLGILLHGTPRKFLDAMNEAVKTTTGIVVQFPFYAGIIGMMTASGLAASISQWFISISTPTTFPLFTFWSAGLLNIFIPSGGGQWAVQGPIMLPVATELGVSHAKVAMAIAWGDAWTNLIQPFWALPVLALAGLGARDIMGYCLMMLIVTGAIISLGFLLF
ncbi:short-chain fatty acid transporter [Brevibacillus brevis]|uniref:short-chain fatty acid transporter n=1 Tax=Brevibacillus brevis TaxID=1393 RepID=UPI000D114DDB|nr:short-chain fatty acid transporter [Brevibacillus brevis]PSJ69187.1 short-chain fatty acid transporter [Brevibacillus brevis]RED27526.1 short-chain fatty acids transporter [Brevibacillus brevis]GEC93279.1 short-chain fatty acids transporter [Brevibacillus brevis]VEF91379.1 Short-chain fatty acids transporter [Brevibacillus brevis]